MLQETIHFEGFELDTGAFELRRDGQLIKLERIPLQLLLLLADVNQALQNREGKRLRLPRGNSTTY